MPVSAIGFGCGGYWGLPVFRESSAAELLQRALERGVTLLDTGPNYSFGNAEARLGRLLGGDRGRVFLATKVGSRLLPDGSVTRDFTPEGMEESLVGSLARLRTDHVDLLQMHGPSLDVLRQDAVLARLESFVSRGMVRFIGASADGEAAEHVAASARFDALMTTYNVVAQESGPTLQRAREAGLAVLVKSPLAHHLFGRELLKLTRPSKVWYLLRVLKNYRHLIGRAQRLRLSGLMPGWAEAQVALKFVLAHGAVTSAVVGTTDARHLEQNLRVCELEDLPEAAMARIARGAGERRRERA